MKFIPARILAVFLAALLLFSSLGVMAEGTGAIMGEAANTDSAGNAPVCVSSSAAYNKNEWEVLALTNATRLSMGIPAMTTFGGAQSACDVRAEELYELFSHTRPDGRSCFSALDDMNVPYFSAGENIAAGYGSAESVVDGWLNSPGHRANMLNPSFFHMGVGYYKTSGGYRYHWVQLFCSSYSERTLSVYLEGADNLAVERGRKIADMDITLHEENSVYGDCVCPLIDEMCTGYNPDQLGIQTVTANFGGFKVDFTVNVGNAPEPLKLNKTSAKLSLGEKIQLTANNSVKEWKSSDVKVAAVDQNGLVTGVGTGKCTITATASSGEKASCNIEVTATRITSIKLDRTKYSVTLKKGDALGETFRLNATIKPKKASVKTLKWKSSNKDVATVDENGLVTIVGFGKCTITAKATDGSGKKAACTVTVNKKQVTSIVLSGKAKMKKGETQSLSAAIKPKKAFNQTLKWKSSNPAILSVDANGVVTAHKKGTATITCTAKDGSKVKAKFNIKVTK